MPNPKEQVHAITLRSGRDIQGPSELANAEKDKEVAEIERSQSHPIPTIQEKLNDIQDHLTAPGKSQEEVDPNAKYREVPKPPFPSRFQNPKLNKQFSKFLDVLRKLHINIPFVEALENMPIYMKFMKDILTKKRRLEEFETIALTEECSAILQHKLPPKLKDPGSFTIPCKIGNISFSKALCDLGASVNLMPYSFYRKLGLGDIKPTNISLQLADRSIKRPRGILEDVLVKVDKLIFPADFVVLDMEEEDDIPLILGRPFLATSNAIIDVNKGELALSIQEEVVKFKGFSSIPHPDDVSSCYYVDAVETKNGDHGMECMADSSTLRLNGEKFGQPKGAEVGRMCMATSFDAG